MFLLSLNIVDTMQSWHDGFNFAALGVGLLVGEYYIITKGFSFLKKRIEDTGTDLGASCWVRPFNREPIVFKTASAVPMAVKNQLQNLLKRYLAGLVLAGILWIVFIGILGFLLFN
ncbi:hypothetical protein M3P19_10715 [Muricauda sp. 2012CJ35-5]|uniref:DUF3899 domain-containing protein n=1 Tax=Flagellimonas spongiicola TaxID=2942208 RepID=A0ABT0PT90_9FLAO|nr:hypothetical protein [Allomuricauda spongiicola]MCL6274486.1 hypothetical protein [Allomuricauda spongiicola]